MKDEKVKIRFDSFEYNLLINGIFELHNMLLEQDIPTEDVEALLIKIIDKAEGKRYGKDDH